MGGTIARMRTETLTLEAGADVRLGRLVELRSDGKVYEAVADSPLVIGVAIEGTSNTWPLPTDNATGEDLITAGQRVTVLVKGFSMARKEAAYTPSPGDYVKAAAAGEVTAYTSGIDSPDIRVGRVYEVSGDYVLLSL